jgi:hypothetical protein
VLKRERRPRPEETAETSGEESDEPMSDIVPPDLAQLEDTIFRDSHKRRDEPNAETDEVSDVNGSADSN